VPGSPAPVDAAATGWLLASAALVLLMTPGIALFYGGMVRRSNVLSVLVQAFGGMAAVSLLWVTVGFSLAFSGDNPYLGDLDYVGIPPGQANPIVPGIPLVVYAVFQMMFAVITGALILGAGAERWRFGAYLLFIAVWSTAVYAPVAHWVFDPRGWAHRWGVLDFAGGTVVHITAGAAALGVALTLGRRRGWPDQPTRPHNLPLVMSGLGLLWFGWLGFNGGRPMAPANWRAWRCSTARSRPPRACSPGCWPSGSGTASPPPSGPRPARWPAWSRSRPPPVLSRPSRPWPSARSPVCCATSPPVSSAGSIWTMPWTWPRFTLAAG
jgi:ammonia channel protein AmtB